MEKFFYREKSNSVPIILKLLTPTCYLVCLGLYEQEAQQLIERGLVMPSLDYVLKCSHSFNLLDARGVIAVTERTRYIGRIRNMARQVAQLYLEQRESLGHPLQKAS